MTLAELDRWLGVYGRAWENKDVDGFVGCFTPDAVYFWGPSWDEPLRGHDQIRARTEQAIADQDRIEFGHETLAITPDGRGIARWWVSIEVPAAGTVELEGIFLVTLDDEGLCTDFREWWNNRPRPPTSSSS
jgi:hypothetical protein